MRSEDAVLLASLAVSAVPASVARADEAKAAHVDESTDGETNAAAVPAAESPPPRGWIGVGGRNAFGFSNPYKPDFGIYGYGGLWILDDHVQPYVRIGWSHGGTKDLSISMFRAAVGLAVGGSVWNERLWLGSALSIEGIGAWASSATLPTATKTGVPMGITLIGQLRLAHRLLIGVDAGPEFLLTPMRFVGPSGSFLWQGARMNAGLLLGVIL